MAVTIWKFPLLMVDSQLVTMPQGAEILTAQHQNGWICLWALVDSEKPKESRVIEIHGTGNPIYEGMGASRKYIATAQEDSLVWHVFERL